MTLLEQGLVISLSGFVLTFLALGLLILTIVLLQALFKPQAASSTSRADLPDSEGTDAEIAAVVAAAVLSLQTSERSASGLGQILEGGHGRWWQASPAFTSSLEWDQVNGKDHR